MEKSNLDQLDKNANKSVKPNDVLVVKTSKNEKPCQSKSYGGPIKNGEEKKRPALASPKNPYKKLRTQVVKKSAQVEGSSDVKAYDVITDSELLQIDLQKAQADAREKYRKGVASEFLSKNKTPHVIDLTRVSK